jgi:REP element-mobilizing transposase RayT
MADSKTILEPDKFYHVYNHAVGNELLFHSDRNYLFFLKKFKTYLFNYVDVYSYCLMPNHFHFIIKVKSESDILDVHYNQNKNETIKGGLVYEIVSRQFSNLFNSYAQAYNKENNRKGSLFLNRFKRKLISDKKYLMKLIHYIHFNPVMANLCKDLSEWKYSSYNAIVTNSNTLILRKQVIELFESRNNFIYCHKEQPMISGIEY